MVMWPKQLRIICIPNGRVVARTPKARIRHFLECVAFVAIAACSPVSTPGSKPPPEAGAYELDPKHAYLSYEMDHLGFSNMIGRFNSFTGTLNIDTSNLEESYVHIVVDVASVDTNNSELDEFLRSDRFFDVAAYPTAEFLSNKITITDGSSLEVAGELRLLDVTQPIKAQVNYNGFGANPFENTRVAGFSATAIIPRSTWGLDLLSPMVGEEVKLMIETEFLKAAKETPATNNESKND